MKARLEDRDEALVMFLWVLSHVVGAAAVYQVAIRALMADQMNKWRRVHQC